MFFKKQSLVELDEQLPFGKYEGKTIEEVYSGNPRKIVSLFVELIDKSFEVIFNKDFYSHHEDSNAINLAGLRTGWVEDDKRLNVESITKLVLALRDGAECCYSVSGKKIKVEIKTSDGKVDAILSMIGCEMAKEYMTRCFASVRIRSDLTIRPAIPFSSDFNRIDEQITDAEGNPNYIYWCIRKVDGFCIRKNWAGIEKLSTIPVFNLGALKVKTRRIKRNFSFKVNLYIEASFEKIPADVIDINHEKYSLYLRDNRPPYFPEQEFDTDVNDYDYGDNGYSDDEDDIMRGLDSGNGDQFGF